MPLLKGITEGIKAVGGLIDNLHTSDEERGKIAVAQKELEVTILETEAELEARLAEAQARINEKEAVHRSIFVAGWRPFIGWVCGTAMALHYVLHPFIELVWPGFPDPDISTMMPVIFGLLGLGGLRTYEKTKGKAK